MLSVWLGFRALKGGLRVSLKVPCMSSSKADLNNSCDQLVFLCYTNNQKKKTNDPNTSGSQFDDNKSDL